MRDRFKYTREWRKLRAEIINKFNGHCCMCGRSWKKEKVRIRVDHIKPVSKYPELKMDPDNLQTLCEDCYLGKLNNFEGDFR